MCRNHSHLVGQFIGESISEGVPALTFVLGNDDLKIEAPGCRTPTFSIPRVGVLYVPSFLLAGSAASTGPATAEQSISLWAIPEGAQIFMFLMWESWTYYLKISEQPENAGKSMDEIVSLIAAQLKAQAEPPAL
jgi:hypothetical protein